MSSMVRRLDFRCCALALVLAFAAFLQPSISKAASEPSYVREEAYSEGVVDLSTIDWNQLAAFLPNRWGDFILPWETLVDQVRLGFGRAPASTRTMPDGHRLLWGCRWQSCDEKAAVVVSPDGKVEAAAIIHYRCHFRAFPIRSSMRWRKSNYTCDIDRKTLTVFLHVDQTYRADFERWAAVVSDEPFSVEIYWV